MNKTQRTIRILERAQERIRDPKHWTQGVEARRASGHPCAEDSPAAVRWCATGALYAEVPPGGSTQAERDARIAAFKALSEVATADRESIVSINDEGPRREAHARIMELFDRTIATLREQP